MHGIPVLLAPNLRADSYLRAFVSMQEPPKAALLAYEASGRRSAKPSRRAFCICQLPSLPGSCVAEVVVDFSSPSPSVLQWNKVGHIISLW